jgi:hypothetical protein
MILNSTKPDPVCGPGGSVAPVVTVGIGSGSARGLPDGPSVYNGS